MFTNLNLFQTSYAMARHAGARQAVTAANMANADTPNYRAQTMESFADSYENSSAGEMRTTRAGHMDVNGSSLTPSTDFTDAEASPNGNSVSLEQEMINAVEVQREHNRALAIYKHSLDVVRMSIGRR
ncbi:FlgB family protein [Octadecabacter sp. 1_MG-2023]|uniref:FlgB family protein n=1 Tax=unclassified Octadecabacter TaxID=196158 RepID=UPI001C08F564|nr:MULTISPECIES: FlgB family protein [unclassified Octadecabacter]MBU2992390.1 FlgB family protein [Octadecabacter sp. B2R22]MDO6734853.1 FlgB family protein [Octadecabacter sp. 1_MG-2023]